MNTPTETIRSESSEAAICRVDELIDLEPVSQLQKNVIFLCALVTMIDGFDAQAIGFLASPIADAFHVDIRSLGPTFSLSLVGLMLGALIMGAVGDRWGRRRALILSVLTVGIFAGLTGFARSLDQLMILRLVTGFGVGGAMPSTMSLIAEYSPARIRASAICWAAACIPLGSMSAGICASFVLPLWGWRAMFYIGGIVPLMLAGAVILALPESVRFLSLDERNEKNIRRIMARIWPSGRNLNVRYVISPASREVSSFPIVELFRAGRTTMTLLLWTTYFMNLLVLYFVVSWLPALLKLDGLPNQAGVTAITAFGLGGIAGSLTQARAMKRFSSHRVLTAEYAVFSVVVATLALVPKLTYPIIAIAALAIGWAIQGAQAGLNVFTSTFYPTSARSTGIGLGLGVGRLGSILGPLLGGLALMSGWSSREIFSVSAVPAICAAIAVTLSASIGLSRLTATSEASPTQTADY